MTKPFGGSETNEEAFFAARVAPNVHVIKTGAIGYDQLFLSKEIVAASAGEIDATSLLRAGAPVDVGYPTDPLSIALDYIVAIKTGPAGADLALKYVWRLEGSRRRTTSKMAPMPSGSPPCVPAMTRRVGPSCFQPRIEPDTDLAGVDGVAYYGGA